MTTRHPSLSSDDGFFLKFLEERFGRMDDKLGGVEKKIDKVLTFESRLEILEEDLKTRQTDKKRWRAFWASTWTVFGGTAAVILKGLWEYFSR